MLADYDEAPGFPAEPTPLRVDLERIGPHVMRRDDRECGVEAQRKYYAAHKERERLRVREAMRALRAARKAAA